MWKLTVLAECLFGFAGILQSAAAQTGTTTATPEFSPVAGTYAATQFVTITDATEGAIIYYDLALRMRTP